MSSEPRSPWLARSGVNPAPAASDRTLVAWEGGGETTGVDAETSGG